ncbi:MAG: hypothetical protein LC109_07400 [Bacteroidia bacterium]|nr:hypothetical protein [Bacteroidia bacterium]
MKRKITFTTVICVLFALTSIISACKKDKKDDNNKHNNTGTKPSCDTTEIFRDINEPTTWKSGKVYVIRSWIDVNAPLTIEEGAIIKFQNSKCGMEILAKVTAEGLESKPIIFTSFKDDEYCGDNNGDYNASKPEKGDWGGITMRAEQHGSSFKFCKFLYGGGNGNGVVNVYSGLGNANDFTFDHCTFAHNAFKNSSAKTDAAFNGSNMKNADVSVLLSNVFYDNTIPIYIAAEYTLDPSNLFHNPDNINQTNKYNGIFLNLMPNGLNGKVVGFSAKDAPYVMDGVLQITGNEVMVVGHNINFKFTNNSSIIAENNNQFAADPSSSFTSYKDDTRGGDTNSDGSTSNPAKNDWEGIQVGGNWYSTNVFYSRY